MRLLFALTAALLPAGAATIYNNGTPNAGGGATFSHFRVVEDFSLAANATVTGLRFWTHLQSSAQTIADLTWAIYGDNAGLPGAVVQSGSATNVAAIVDGVTHRREIAASFNLTAGDYFIEFHAASGLNVEGPLIQSWAFTADNATDRYRQGDLTAVPTVETNNGSGTEQLAFQIDGTFDSEIPEPSSIALAALGLSVLWRKRSSRAANTRRA